MSGAHSQGGEKSSRKVVSSVAEASECFSGVQEPGLWLPAEIPPWGWDYLGSHKVMCVSGLFLQAGSSTASGNVLSALHGVWQAQGLSG